MFDMKLFGWIMQVNKERVIEKYKNIAKILKAKYVFVCACK